jgi:hypothetical protein
MAYIFKKATIFLILDIFRWIIIIYYLLQSWFLNINYHLVFVHMHFILINQNLKIIISTKMTLLIVNNRKYDRNILNHIIKVQEKNTNKTKRMNKY